MKELKISVIMPVYNMGKFIAKALESVEKQTLKEKEIICVDDGSTDDSYDIAISYVQKYSNIVVLRQENMGAGSARNLGIQKARGEFICFLDADDFYASDDVLEYLYNIAKEKNVKVCGGSSCDYKDGKLSVLGVRKERRFSENSYIERENYPGVAGYWAFIFNKNFLIENKICFPPYLRGQDAPFFVKAIACANGAYCCKKLIYVYRKEHKRVEFCINKALGLVKSFRDVLAISSKYRMKYVHSWIIEELKGETGALIYRFAYEGSDKMAELINEINSLVDASLVGKDVLDGQKLLLEKDELKQYVFQNEKIKNELLSKLKSMEKVYVFGAGIIGKKVAEFLKNNQIDIEAFIVSDVSQNPSEVMGIPIKAVQELKKEEQKYIVIIATFWYSQGEIENMLMAREINNIYAIDLRRFFLWQEKISH